MELHHLSNPFPLNRSGYFLRRAKEPVPAVPLAVKPMLTRKRRYVALPVGEAWAEKLA